TESAPGFRCRAALERGASAQYPPGYWTLPGPGKGEQPVFLLASRRPARSHDRGRGRWLAWLGDTMRQDIGHGSDRENRSLNSGGRPQQPDTVLRRSSTRALDHEFRNNPMSCVRLPAALVGLCLVIGSAAAADAPTLTVEVDARELPRKLLHSTLDIPCKPGPLRLWYPKWLPGSHGPHGRVEDVAGFRVETPEGTPVPWTRDEVELHCFVVKVPAGTTSVR